MKILAVGAHPDDVELGCGATLALFRRMGHEAYILVLTKGEASGTQDFGKSSVGNLVVNSVNNLFFGSLQDTKITDGIGTILARALLCPIEFLATTVFPHIFLKDIDSWINKNRR